MIEHKFGMCVINYRSSANSSGASVATKGRLATTYTTRKFVETTDSHIFRKSVVIDFKPAKRFHSFAKTIATGQQPTVYS